MTYSTPRGTRYRQPSKQQLTMLDRFPLFGELEVHGGGEHRTVESLRSRGYVIPVADYRKPNSFVLTDRGRAWRKARYEERMRWRNMGWERLLGQVV